MGFGRSGTSLMGGILHQAGYYMGEDLYPPRISNPMGFFENATINGINERILEKYDYCSQSTKFAAFEKCWSPYKPGEGHRWLSYIPSGIDITASSNSIESEINKALSHSVFAYKDPRFNYTLSVWEPFLPKDTLFLCLFREPGITIRSILTECETADYLSDFSITQDLAEDLWLNSYHHLLKKRESIDPDRFIFIHYQQLLSGEILLYLSNLLQIELNNKFISNQLNRTQKGIIVSETSKRLYTQLCDLSKF